MAEDANSIYYPPVKFKFQVIFTGGNISGEANFLEASGLTQEFGEETIPEGGVLDRVHKVPKGIVINADLVLKRGIVTNSSVVSWIQQAVTSFTFTPIQVQVSLLDPTNNPLMTWTFNNVWPKKWEVDPLNSMENAVAVESLVLAYSWTSFTSQ
jgi:phage tail-like protein